jgi:uncharacterized protein YycO
MPLSKSMLRFSINGIYKPCSVFVLAMILSGCTTLDIQPLATPEALTGEQTKEVDDVSISVAILTDERAQTHFGADLADSGLQVLRLSVQNDTPTTYGFYATVSTRILFSRRSRAAREEADPRA